MDDVYLGQDGRIHAGRFSGGYLDPDTVGCGAGMLRELTPAQVERLSEERVCRDCFKELSEFRRLEDGPTGLETWEIDLAYVTDPDFGAVIAVDEPQILFNVHPSFTCEGRACVIHHPTDHHMRSWPLLWRNDRGIFERLCRHGIGHPDPDQFAYWESLGMEGEAVHGCDGCCAS